MNPDEFANILNASVGPDTVASLRAENAALEARLAEVRDHAEKLQGTLLTALPLEDDRDAAQFLAVALAELAAIMDAAKGGDE